MTKLFLIPFIFLSYINFVFAADVTQFVFTTSSQTIKPNQISDVITVQAQDATGNPVTSHTTGCIQLNSTSGTGQFFSNTTASEPVTGLTLNSNWANRNFYYKDSSSGNYTLTVKLALISCSSWTNEQWTANQNIVVSESATQTQAQTQNQQTFSAQTSQSATVSGGGGFPVEPQIFANAGNDKTGIVGAEVYFSGQALGLQKEPLDNARYVWNLGDGASKEGQNVLHTYLYPGEYIAVLNVSSGQYSASDNLSVKIVASQIKITEANSDYIKIFNGSGEILDLSNWSLKAGNKTFTFPKNTIVKANSSLTIPSLNSGIMVYDSAALQLLYPNGSIAFSWQKTPEPAQIIPAKVEPAPVLEKEKSSLVETSDNQEQAASVITLEEKSSLNPKTFIFVVIGVGLAAVIGLLFIRRKTT